jgi:hypothetical protein
MSARRQSIAAALRDRQIVRALNGLVGCPVGGWAETAQAERRLVDELPRKAARTYSINELIDAALVADHADRYAWRDTDGAS